MCTSVVYFDLHVQDSYFTTVVFIPLVAAEKLEFEMEMCLVSSQPWVKCPKHLCMWPGGNHAWQSTSEQICSNLVLFVCLARQFIVEVETRGLEPGAHFAEVSS